MIQYKYEETKTFPYIPDYQTEKRINIYKNRKNTAVSSS